jgi:hypothetical protein
MSILKRQRELKKSEKAAHKRAKRHGTSPPGFQEPTPTIGTAELLGLAPDDDKDDPEHAVEAEPEEEPQH